MEEYEFWMVWNPQGRAPAYQHLSRDTAKAEAERLAGVAPGQLFFVLHAVACCRRSDLQWDKCLTRPVMSDEVPF